MRIGLVNRAHRDCFVQIGGIANRKVHIGRDFTMGCLQYGVPFVPGCQAYQHALIPESPQLLAQRRMAAAVNAGIEIPP